MFSVVLSLFSGVLCTMLSGKKARIYTIIYECVQLVMVAAVLRYTVVTGEAFTYVLGEFPAPWGNELRAGTLEASIAVLFIAVMLCAVLAGQHYVRKDIDESKVNIYYAILNLMTAALMAMTWTNDIFSSGDPDADKLRRPDSARDRQNDTGGGALHDPQSGGVGPVSSGRCAPVRYHGKSSDGADAARDRDAVPGSGRPGRADHGDRHPDHRTLDQERTFPLPLLDAGHLRLGYAYLRSGALVAGLQVLHLLVDQNILARDRDRYLYGYADPQRFVCAWTVRNGVRLGLGDPGGEYKPDGGFLVCGTDRLHLYGDRTGRNRGLYRSIWGSDWAEPRALPQRCSTSWPTRSPNPSCF